MNKTVVFFGIFLLITNLFAWEWEENGIPVRTGVNIEWARTGISLDDDTVVYGWSDTRRGDRDVYAQKIDSNGNFLWGEGGILINGEIDRQEDIVLIGVGNGEVIAAWVDFRNEDAGDIYAQKLDSEGNLLWDEAGVPLCLAENVQISLNIVNDDNGGAYIIWLDSRNPGGSDIYGTHILANGEIAAGWEQNGNPIIATSGHQNQHTFWEDGEGGAILIWHDDRVATDENIYMQRITSDGSLLWGDTGTLLCDAADVQETPKIAPDGTGGFIISWRDKRNDVNGDIYAQRIDLDGNLLWTTEKVIYAGDGIQENARITKSNDNNGAIIVWEDGRNNFEYRDIYAQKIDLNGNLVWNSEGVAVCTEDFHQKNPRLVGDANGGAWIIWDDARGAGYPQVDIYLQHLNSDGEIQLAENGEIVCNAAEEQFSPLVKINGSGVVFTSWGDNRDGSTGLYIQIFDNNGNPQLAENGIIVYYGLCGDAKETKFLKNGNQPVLVWKDTRYPKSQIYMQVLNGDGSVNLEDDGVPVTNYTGYDQISLDAKMIPETNEIGIVWQENRIGYNQIFVQGVDLNGNHLWSDEGILAGDYVSEQQFPQISVKNFDGTIEYIVGWSDFRADYTFGIYAQKIVNGEKQWDAEGKEIVDTATNDQLNDLVGNYFIWQTGSFNDQNILVKLVDEDGNTAENWPENGLMICSAPGNQTDARGIITSNGLLVIWNDLRDGNLDIYGQLISEDGEIQWQENGVPMINAINDQRISSYIFQDDNFYLIWEDFRNGFADHAYLQKYDMTASALWDEDGVRVAYQDSSQIAPSITSDGENFFAFWKDTRNSQSGHPNSDIYAQKINSEGEIQWGDDGELICNAIKNQNSPLATTDNYGNVYVVWEDTRSSGKTDIYNIYAQKISNTAVSDEEIEPSFSNRIFNIPNPFRNYTTISFNISNETFEKAEIEIYNIKGQKIKTLPVSSQASSKKSGRFSIAWNGNDEKGKPVSSGIYFYKLKIDGKAEAMKKCLLIK